MTDCDWCSSYKTLFVFSECNEKTVAIANSIKHKTDTDGSFGDYRVVFSVLDNQDTSRYSKLLTRINAFLINEDVESIFERINGKSQRIEIFLFNEEEERNLQQLGGICDREISKSDVWLYAEVNRTHWSLYDEYIKRVTKDNEHLTINLVRTEENFIYNLLLKESIFENAINGKDAKLINILIVGYNDRNIEFLKAVLHLGQMPGYGLKVTLIDEYDRKNEIRYIMPEILECGIGYGDSIYQFKQIYNVDYKSAEYDELIKSELKDFTFAFINAGDDLVNADIAIHLNRLSIRENLGRDKKIVVSVTDKEVCCDDKWNNGIISGIDFVGDIAEVYNYSFITMSKIEEATIQIHDVRQKERAAGKPDYKIQSWKDYCNNEYNRHSVYARTLSFAYKVKFIGEMNKDNEDQSIYLVTNSSEKWKIYEHMRWNVYTRTLGFVKAPSYMLNDKGEVDRSVRNAAKVHHSLVPFDQLPEDEKMKDSLTLTPAIVNILKELLVD